MSDEDLLVLYNGFVAAMQQNDLGWVVNQIEEQLGELPERDLGNTNLPPDRYTVQEQLLLLLRAVEFVIVDTADMEAQIVDYFLGKRRNNILRFPDDYFASNAPFQSENQIIQALSSDEWQRAMFENALEDAQDFLFADTVDMQALAQNQQQRQAAAEQFRVLIAQIRAEILNG